MQHRLAIAPCQRHGLLDDHMASGMQGGNCLGCVQPVGRANAHHIQTRMGCKQLLDGTIERHLLSYSACRARACIRRRHHRTLRLTADHFCVPLADVAHADHRELQVFHRTKVHQRLHDGENSRKPSENSTSHGSASPAYHSTTSAAGPKGDSVTAAAEYMDPNSGRGPDHASS